MAEGNLVYTVRWSQDDAQWVATRPDHPSLSWLGDTAEEALRGLHDLILTVTGDSDG